MNNLFRRAPSDEAPTQPIKVIQNQPLRTLEHNPKVWNALYQLRTGDIVKYNEVISLISEDRINLLNPQEIVMRAKTRFPKEFLVFYRPLETKIKHKITKILGGVEESQQDYETALNVVFGALGLDLKDLNKSDVLPKTAPFTEEGLDYLEDEGIIQREA